MTEICRSCTLHSAVYRFRFFNDGRWLSHLRTAQAFVGALFLGVANNVELALKLPGSCTRYLNGFSCMTAKLRSTFFYHQCAMHTSVSHRTQNKNWTIYFLYPPHDPPSHPSPSLDPLARHLVGAPSTATPLTHLPLPRSPPLPPPPHS